MQHTDTIGNSSAYELHSDDSLMVDEKGGATKQKRSTSASRKRLLLVVASVLALCVSLGAGFWIGWAAKGSSNEDDDSLESNTASTTFVSTSNSSPRAVSDTPTPTPTPTPAPAPLPRYMFVGDSITLHGADKGGFTDLFKTMYNGSIEVLNRGVSGYNTEWTLSNTIPDVANEIRQGPEPVVITLWLGNNDAGIIGGNYQDKHVPIDAFKVNLVTILVSLRQVAPNADLVLITPSVIDNDTRLKLLIERNQTYDPLDRSNEQAGLYAEACREVATLMTGVGVSLLDIYHFFMDAYPNTTERATVMNDGLHYSALGDYLVFGQLTDHFLKLHPNAFDGNNTQAR